MVQSICTMMPPTCVICTIVHSIEQQILTYRFSHIVIFYSDGVSGLELYTGMLISRVRHLYKFDTLMQYACSKNIGNDNCSSRMSETLVLYFGQLGS